MVSLNKIPPIIHEQQLAFWITENFLNYTRKCMKKSDLPIRAPVSIKMCTFQVSTDLRKKSSKTFIPGQNWPIHQGYVLYGLKSKMFLFPKPNVKRFSNQGNALLKILNLTHPTWLCVARKQEICNLLKNWAWNTTRRHI